MIRKKKLYLVGIDSAPLWIIDELINRPRMTGFRAFKNKGFLTSIESTIPPVTSTAWPTIYTGLAPKSHGVIDFSTLNEDYSKELTFYDATKNPPFWDTLATAGLRSLVITPAVVLQKSRHEKVDMVTGWPLEPRFSSTKIGNAAKHFKYYGEPDIGNALNTGKISLEKATKEYVESMKRRSELSKYLLEKNDYDLSFVCFTETDRIQHYSLNLSNWADYVAPLYEEISDFIGYVRSRIENGENAAIMVVSDHGAQPIRYKFLSNSWMINENYAKLNDRVQNQRVSGNDDGVLHTIKRKMVNTLVESKLRRRIYKKMPKSIKKLGEKFVEDSYDYEYKGKYIRITESDFEMSNTKAFCGISAGTVGMVLINDSRFSSPGITESKKDPLKKEIMRELSKIRDLDGEPLISFVHDGAKYFSSNGKSIVPDIVFGLKDGFTSDYTGYAKGKFFVDPEINRRGEHTRFGIFGMIAPGNKVPVRKSPKLSDINPIILKYFGI